MKNYENSESYDSEGQKEIDDSDDYSDIDSDRPNLLQINKKIDKMKKEEETKLLEKKHSRNKNDTDIQYDAKKKKIINSFVPNLEELNEFLNKCTIKEINLDDIEKEIKNIQEEKIFDPDSFIEKNYGNNEINLIKNNLSIEDLGSKYEKIDINNQKEEELLQSEEYINNNDQDYIENIYKENNIKKQKKELNELINKIKKMSIEEIIESNKDKANKKLNIVFDLDNTCIFAFTISGNQIMKLREEFPKKDIKALMFQFEKQYMFSAIIVRNGLKEFFASTKNYCNYYINTLGYESYGLEIKKFLENKFEIQFCGYKGRRKENEKSKSLSDLKLATKNTVIFDDKPVWKKDNANVIISKIFTDREIILKELQRKNLQNNINSFLNDYYPFLYYCCSPVNWREQKLKEGRNCPFYDFRKLICFNGEYLESTKFQFIYMKEITKIIYYLVYNSNIDVPKALKLIRYNIFYNSCFNLNYANNGKSALEDIIVNCGGVIYNENNKKEYDSMKYFFVCNKEDYLTKKDEIKKDKRGKENCKVVSDKYILNSFYFMTNLEDELNNPQYRLDINDEDDFGNY